MKKLLSLFLLSLSLTACGSRSSDDEVALPSSSSYTDYDAIEEAYDEPSYEELTLKESMPVSGESSLSEEKIIRTGYLSLHVEDVRESVETIRTTVEGWGGEVLDSNVNRYGNAYYADLTLRVSAEDFDASMTGLKEMSFYVLSESTSVLNVTDVYMDLDARLNNLRSEEEQYLDILERAQNVEEILQVTDYLSDVRYQIESIESQLKYYDTNVSYSTITLTLTEDESIDVVKETWRPAGTVKEALSDWFIFLQDLVDFAIYALIFAWPVLLLGLVFWLLRRRILGPRAKRK